MILRSFPEFSIKSAKIGGNKTARVPILPFVVPENDKKEGAPQTPIKHQLNYHQTLAVKYSQSIALHHDGAKIVTKLWLFSIA